MTPPAPLRPIARRALATQSDERLIRLVRDGHEPAFEEMVRRYRGPLVAFASAIVSADGAEDVVQASLEKAHRALLADAREINLRPWFFAIVRNGALNAVRREPRVDELSEAMATAAGPSEIAEQREDLDRLVVAMCALPEAQRQALVKRELEGVGHGEIAAQLGTTATAVRGLIFRARTGLRDVIGAMVPLPVLRNLMTEGAAVGAAGGGASIALLGGAGAKGGTAIAAVIVALGTGIAIDHGRDPDPKKAEQVSQKLGNGTDTTISSAAAVTETAAGSEGTADQAARSDTTPEGTSQDGTGSEGGGSGGSGDDSAATSIGGSEETRDDGSSTSGEDSGTGGDSGDSGGSSGSGPSSGGAGPGHGGPGPSGGTTQQPPPDDDGDDDGGGGPGPSGPGGPIHGGPSPSGPGTPPPDDEGDDSSGHGPGGGDQPQPPPEEPEDGSHDEDHSGPGNDELNP